MNKELLGKGTFTHLFIQLDNYNIKFNQEILKEKHLIHKTNPRNQTWFEYF